MLGVGVGSGVRVIVSVVLAVSVEVEVAVSMGSAEAVNVVRNGVFVFISGAPSVGLATELHPTIIASEIKTKAKASLPVT